MRQVDTRGGIFAEEGYGGGVFNQNVAFGGVGRTCETAPSGLGQFVVDFPQRCWENDAFRDCYYQYVGYAGSDCNDPSVVEMYTDREDCVRDLAQYDVWQHCVTEYCTASGQQPPQSVPKYEPYPWNVKSEQTKNLQADINLVLRERGCETIAEDGLLGPTTCGAARYVDPSIVPTTCTKFTEPDCPDVEQPPPPQPLPPPPDISQCPPGQRMIGGACTPIASTTPSKQGLKLGWLVGGLLIASAVGGGIAYAAKKKKGAGGR